MRSARTAIPLSQYRYFRCRKVDLADMTGHARQTINAAVNRLENEGLIRVGHRQIEILDLKGLDAYFTGEKS